MGAAVAFALVMIACGDDGPAATTTTSPAGETTTTTRSTAQDASLASAIEAVGTRYAFTAIVTLDDVDVTTVEGTVYDGTGSYVVSTGGSNVEYIASDQGQWAREPGAEWAPLSGAAPLRDPLGPLTAPLSTSVIESDGNRTIVEAVYDGSTLGFASDDEVTVTITIVDGAVASITYDALVGEAVATVTTGFDPTVAVDPIQVPPA